MTWTQLHDACVHQDTSHVIELAHAHSEQAWKADDHGLTPLHILVWGNPSAEAVKALLEASPQAVSDIDVHGDTPLHLACSNPNADKHLIQMLLDACPTAASMKNHEGLMPLHMACRYTRNEAVIGLLIENYPYALRTQIKVRSITWRMKCDRTFILRTMYSDANFVVSSIQQCVYGRQSPFCRQDWIYPVVVMSRAGTSCERSEALEYVSHLLAFRSFPCL
jgi:ankyrin repeat protein